MRALTQFSTSFRRFNSRTLCVLLIISNFTTLGQDQQVIDSFENAAFRENFAKNGLILARCVGLRKYEGEEPDKQYMGNPNGPLYLTSSKISQYTINERDENLALPPQSRADVIVELSVKPGTRLLVGIAAEGYWITPTDKTKKMYLLPIHKIKQDPLLLQKVKEQERNGEIKMDYKKGGETQYVVLPEDRGTNNSNFEKRKVTIALHTSPTNNTKTETYQKPTQTPTPTINVKSNSTTKPIEQQIQRYNNSFPGGVIVEPKAVLPEIKRVKFDKESGVFIINKNYEFNPSLDEDDISIIYNSVFNTTDMKLAAVSQYEFSGLPADSYLAKILSQADNVLGKIAYGYDSRGVGLKKKQELAGYRNPLNGDYKILLDRDWTKITQLAMLNLSGSQPRLFMNFESVRFQLDEENKTFRPTEVGMTIQYQAFTEQNGKIAFLEKSPEYYYPAITDAIKHLEKNYTTYEERFPEFLKARKVAELYAFFRYLKENDITFSDKKYLTKVYDNRLKLPDTFEMYNNIEKGEILDKSNQVFFTTLKKAEADVALTKQSLSKENIFALNYLLFNYALNSDNYVEAKTYRQKALDSAKLIFSCTPTAIYHLTLEDIFKALHTQVPMNVAGKEAFIEKYASSGSLLCEQYLEPVKAFYEKMLLLENATYGYSIGYHSVLTKMGRKSEALVVGKNFEKQIIAASDKGDGSAMNTLSKAFFNKNDNVNGKLYLIKSSDNCNTEAMNVLGVAYQEGKYGLAKDIKKATELCLRSYNNGKNHWAAYNLGIFSENNRDLVNAKIWLRKSADLGNEPAQKRLSEYQSVGL